MQIHNRLFFLLSLSLINHFSEETLLYYFADYRLASSAMEKSEASIILKSDESEKITICVIIQKNKIVLCLYTINLKKIFHLN